MDLLNALMEGQGMTKSQALEAIKEMKLLVKDGEDPGDVLYDYGLEPDYFLEIL